jgi:predicted transcriptional regulator of viral defense system
MEKELGDYILKYYSNRLPRLTRIHLMKIKKQNIHRYSSLHYGAFKIIKGKNLRVSTIGRTFLDMLRKPDLCGGIHHVIEIYKEFSNRYLNLIIDETDRHGNQIDKVRAGYILEEICGQKESEINNWIRFVQRGGSRKLDPTEEYSSTYSEKWCLSINID